MFLEALEAAAITLLFVQGSIFKPLRERGPAFWQELASCPLCLGFWVGVLGHAARQWEVEHTPAMLLWKLVAAGALSGVIALICKFVLGALDELIFALDQLGRHVQLHRVRQRKQDKLYYRARKRMALASKRKRMRRIERDLARQQANEACPEHKCPKGFCEAYHPGGALYVPPSKHHKLCRDSECPGLPNCGRSRENWVDPFEQQKPPDMTEDSEIRESTALSLAELVGGKAGAGGAERVLDLDVPSFERGAGKRILGRLALPMSLSSQVRLRLVPWSLLAALTGPHPAMRFCRYDSGNPTPVPDWVIRPGDTVAQGS